MFVLREDNWNMLKQVSGFIRIRLGVIQISTYFNTHIYSLSNTFQIIYVIYGAICCFVYQRFSCSVSPHSGNTL